MVKVVLSKKSHFRSDEKSRLFRKCITFKNRKIFCVIGKKGYGMSLALERLAEIAYLKDYKVIMTNDIRKEFDC